MQADNAITLRKMFRETSYFRLAIWKGGLYSIAPYQTGIADKAQLLECIGTIEAAEMLQVLREMLYRV